ncbi:autophagy 9 [Actinidia rufa]|uniref:Autophagy-related protein 9 n=1 Tax=Actinidia rufa TaxID=165716 RepID=A0A7J0FS86_9ERIC|nr:autophagy 9 [Actinidia rufa]
MMLLEEMASIFLTPYLLLFVVPKRVDDILQFIADFTVNVEGVGHVCSFQSSYPTWDPKCSGKAVSFDTSKIQGPNAARGWNKTWNAASMDPKFQRPRGQKQLLGKGNAPKHSRNRLPIRNVHRGPFDSAEEGSRDFWVPPPHLPQNEATYEENWSHLFEDRSRSHLEASTSAPLLCESVLQHHDSSSVAHPTKSHWWARSRPHGADPQTSFLEPPNFNHNIPNNYYDHFSDRSLEEEEQHFDWRSSHGLSRTYYMNNLEGGEFNLPFDDIYSRPSESPSMNFDPTSSV